MVTVDFTNFMVFNWAVSCKGSMKEERSKVKFDFKALDFHNSRSLGQVNMVFHSSKRSRRTAITEGLIAGMLFGTSSIFIRLLDVLSVSSLAFWRLIIASVVLVGIALVLREAFSLRVIEKNIKQISILGMFLGLHIVLYISAVKNTTILNATVLVNTAPIFSMLVSTFHFNLKPSRLAVMGLTTSFLGAGLIAYADASSPLEIHLIGDFEALLAAIAEAFSQLWSRNKE